MKFELKNYEVLNLSECISAISQMGIEKPNKRFNYSIVLNEEELKGKVKAIQAIAKPSDSYLEYENKRNEILFKYADKEENGNVKIRDNRWVVFKDNESEENAKIDIEKLDEEFSEIIEQRKTDIEDYNKILEESVNVNIAQIDIDEVPDEVGKDIQMLKALKPMIK